MFKVSFFLSASFTTLLDGASAVVNVDVAVVLVVAVVEDDASVSVDVA